MKRLLCRSAWSIRGRMMVLAIGPTLFVLIVVAVVEVLTPEDRRSVSYPGATALRIELIVEQVRGAAGPVQASAILDAAERMGLRVEEVPASVFDAPTQPHVPAGDIRRALRKDLLRSYEVILRNRTASGSLRDVLVVRIDTERALAFALDPDPLAGRSIDTLAQFILKASILLTIVLAFLASNAITGPLSRFAAAAQGLSSDDGPDRPFEERGAREIVALARALNDMRSRIREMAGDRTRMLRGIGHDLRTPLTRLRLRAERSTQVDLREAMLRDIVHINDMIEEALVYLREDVSAERLLRADLPSLLQTVCADFTDIGFSVHYQGPDRFTYECKPRALARAIANLVDNGTKFATKVAVRLDVAGDGVVRIDVADDGPGLPQSLRPKAFVPFHKADSIRASTDRNSFGLGLSIVHDIVRGHGGMMAILDEKPQGLVVRLQLPARKTTAGERAARKTVAGDTPPRA